MIEHIPDIIKSGITSLKIEGRMKSVFYVATVIHAYRRALDAFLSDEDNYEFDQKWMDELLKVSHREFTTGFYYDKPTNKDQNYQTSAYTREYTFVGVVRDCLEDGYVYVEQRNKMSLGDEIECFGPDMDFKVFRLEEMMDLESLTQLETAPHPQQRLKMKIPFEVKPNYILRKKK